MKQQGTHLDFWLKIFQMMQMKIFKNFWLIHDSTAKASFEDGSLENFWVMMEKAYSKVAKKPRTLLTVFSSTYLCESAFSSVVAVKTKA